GLVLVGIFQCVAVGWIYGADKLRAYINQNSKYKLGPIFDHLIKWIIPLILIFFVVSQFLIELEGPYEGYPGWAIAIGWATVVIPLIVFIGWAIKARKVVREVGEEKRDEMNVEKKEDN
ncbi:MAG: hypothetical protein CMI52_02885, partial [Parcubacteria group bacterium]|nr:hypothetical protein [Parcubacteria group bacterium]